MWFYFNRSIIKGLLNNFRLFIDGDTKMSENYQKQKKFALSLTAQQIQEYITSIPNKIDKSSIVQNLLPENLSEEKVPSSRALQDSLDKVTENFDTSSKVNEKVYQNIARAFGLNYVGTFKDGFTYTLETDVAVDSNGDFWRDKTGNLPRTIPDSSTPNQVDYFKVELSKNRNLFQELLVTTSLLTTLGSSTLDSLLVSGGQLVLDEVHFGEAVYSPTTTSMSSTTYIAKVDGVTKNFFNASQVIVDVNIPSDIGGFNFSEIAILDDHSRIAFMGKVDLFQKVEKVNSVGVNLTVRLYLNLTNQAHVDIITGTKPETYISENEPPASYARWWIPSEGKAYIRYNDGDSVQWVQEGSSSGGSDGGYGRTIVSETRPNSVFEKSGQRWWIPSQLKAFIWYDDGDSGQWIQETISDSTGGSDATIISSTKPDQSYEQSGRRWWNPTTGLAYIWYEDGDSGQWVQENNSAPPMQRHNDTIDRNSVGSHDDIYVRTRTLAEALAEDAPVGTRYTITDRYNAEMKVVEHITADGMVYHDMNNGLTLQLRPFGHEIYLEWLGATGSINQNLDAIFIRGIELLRANPSQIQEGIGEGSPIITAYSSGTILLGRGIYAVSPEVLDITQDVGLTIKGQGFSGQQNFKRGATTLLIDGASSTFGIRSKGNGGRSFKLENLDVCYINPLFTGRLIDNLDAVGLQLENVYLGCFGTSALSRLFTASSLLGMTYAEYAVFKNVVFNGAVNFVEFDNSRTIGGSTFGNSVISFENCVGYDCTGTMIVNDGTRTVEGLELDFTGNPITTNCLRVVDLDNVDALTLTVHCAPSTAATGGVTEWIRVHNCSGTIAGCTFGDLAKAGTINGDLCVEGNKFGGTDGFTVTGGNITGGGNEFRTGTNGWLFAPTSQLTISLNPDRFESGVTSSYYLPTDTTLVSGNILYSWERDNSTSKFEINSPRVRVDNAGKITTVNITPATTPFVETGNIQNVGGLAQNMQITLPTPRYCTGYAYNKFLDSTYTLTLNAPAGSSFICGEAGTRTQAVATNVGSYIEFESMNANTYIVTSLHGDWVFS